MESQKGIFIFSGRWEEDEEEILVMVESANIEFWHVNLGPFFSKKTLWSLVKSRLLTCWDPAALVLVKLDV